MTLVETIAELASVEDKIAAELARVGRGSVRHGELSKLRGEIAMVKARLIELRVGELNPFLTALERQRERQGRRAELMAPMSGLTAER